MCGRPTIQRRYRRQTNPVPGERAAPQPGGPAAPKLLSRKERWKAKFPTEDASKKSPSELQAHPVGSTHGVLSPITMPVDGS